MESYFRYVALRMLENNNQISFILLALLYFLCFKGSLIPETLKEMESNEEFKVTAENLRRLGQKALTKEEKKQRQRALNNLQVPHFLKVLKQKRIEKGISGNRFAFPFFNVILY